MSSSVLSAAISYCTIEVSRRRHSFSDSHLKLSAPQQRAWTCQETGNASHHPQETHSDVQKVENRSQRTERKE